MVFRTSNATSCNNPNCECHVKGPKATSKEDHRALFGWLTKELGKREVAKPTGYYDPTEEQKRIAEFDKRLKAWEEEEKRENQAPLPPDPYAKIRPRWQARTATIINDVPLPPTTRELFQKD